MTRRIKAASTKSPATHLHGETETEFAQDFHQAPTSNSSTETATENCIDETPSPSSIFRLGAQPIQATEVPRAIALSQPNTPLPLQPFQVRLAHRRQAYVPTQSRTPWQSLNSLFSSGQLQCIALFESQGCQGQSHWAMARVPGLTTNLQGEGGDRIQAYLRIDIAHNGDLTLELVPALEPQQLLAAAPLLTQSRGITPFRLLTADNFIARLEQLRELPAQLQLQFETCISLYRQLEQQALHPNQARQYFDRLLDRSPLPPSQTPASERLLQRRQLLQAFTKRTHLTQQPSSAEIGDPPGLSMWDAYATVAGCSSPGLFGSDQGQTTSSLAASWLSCGQGPSAELIHLAQELALSWRPSAAQPRGFVSRRSGAQRSLEASGALQMRIQQRRSKSQIPQLAEAAASR